MQKWSFIAILLCGCLSGCIPPQPETPYPSLEMKELKTGAAYTLYVPSYYTKDQAWPLVVPLHGTYGFDDPNMQVTEWKDVAERHGLIVAAPVLRSVQGILPIAKAVRQQDLESDEKTVLAVIDDVCAKYNIAIIQDKLLPPPKGVPEARTKPAASATQPFSRRAILLTGFSAGGYPLWYVGLRNPERFHMLIGMGAKITGVGTSQLTVTGVKRLTGGTFTINTDYHEVVTFLALGAITGGEVRVRHSLPHHFDLIARAFAKLGVVIEHQGDTAIVRRRQKLVIEPPFTSNLLPKIEAAPWPYFPVDLLPCMIALSVRAKGAIQFWNKVYEGGFTWMPELSKFGAHVVVSDPHRIIVFGDRPLRPTTVDAPYIIRAAVALYMVAASIPGRSVVKNADTIMRAHPRFVENLRSLGADVEWK